MKEIVNMNAEVSGKNAFQLRFKVESDISTGASIFESARLKEVFVYDEDENPELARELKTFFFSLPREIMNRVAYKLYDRTCWEEADGEECVGTAYVDCKELAGMLVKSAEELEERGEYSMRFRIYLDTPAVWPEWGKNEMARLVKEPVEQLVSQIKEKLSKVLPAVVEKDGVRAGVSNSITVWVSIPAQKVTRAVKTFMHELGWWGSPEVKRKVRSRLSR